MKDEATGTGRAALAALHTAYDQFREAVVGKTRCVRLIEAFLDEMERLGFSSSVTVSSTDVTISVMLGGLTAASEGESRRTTAPDPLPLMPPVEQVAEPVAVSAASPKAASPKRPSFWTEQEIGILRDGLARGVTIPALAARLGRPEPGTYQKIKLLRKAGLLPRARQMAKPPTQPLPPPRATPAPSRPVAPAVAKAAPVAPPAAPVVAKAAPVAPPVLPKTVPAVEPVIATAPPFDPARPGWWREIEANLNELGHRAPWTAVLDLALVEGLASGAPKEVVADELGVEVGAARQRFIALTPNGVTIEGQQRLLQVLRARAPSKLEASK